MTSIPSHNPYQLNSRPCSKVAVACKSCKSRIKIMFRSGICAGLIFLVGTMALLNNYRPDEEEMKLRTSTAAAVGKSWCDKMKNARAKLDPSLHIDYKCDDLPTTAKSAVVCMLTDGVADESKATRIVFTATNYLHGAMALGASLKKHIDPSVTHMLLLLREGFTLEEEDQIRLQSVGWTLGTAPNVPLPPQFLPRWPRYKTTYTKITAIGLDEYDCVMLMDADTLAVGDMREALSCSMFKEPHHRLGGTLDWYRGRWHFFNTGSILWRTSSKEMERVKDLISNTTFMRRFSSDQDFLNNAYPERLNNTFNDEIAHGVVPTAPWSGAVLPMSWDYNAQTHVEVQRTDFWDAHRSNVRILHFTEKKGWQCLPERHTPPLPEEVPKECNKDIPICFCREAHLYWNALQEAQALAAAKLQRIGMIKV